MTREEKEAFLFQDNDEKTDKSNIKVFVRMRDMSDGEKGEPERRVPGYRLKGNILAVPGSKFGE